MLRPQSRTSWAATAAAGGKTLIVALISREGLAAMYAATGRSRWMRVDVRYEGDVTVGRRGD